MGIASLVFGILAFLFFCLPWVGIVFAILAIVFGGIAIKTGNYKGLGIAGLVLGILSFFLALFFLFIWLSEIFFSYDYGGYGPGYWNDFGDGRFLRL